MNLPIYTLVFTAYLKSGGLKQRTITGDRRGRKKVITNGLYLYLGNYASIALQVKVLRARQTLPGP